jgi:hypothetical protein
MRLSVVEMGNFGEKEGQPFELPHPQGKATWGSGVTPGDQELVPGVLEGPYGSTSAGSGELEELAPALAEVEPLERALRKRWVSGWGCFSIGFWPLSAEALARSVDEGDKVKVYKESFAW